MRPITSRGVLRGTRGSKLKFLRQLTAGRTHCLSIPLPSHTCSPFSLTFSLMQPVTSAVVRSTGRSPLHFRLSGGRPGVSPPFRPSLSGTHTALQHSTYHPVPAPSSAGTSREGWDLSAQQLRKPKGEQSCPHCCIQRGASRASWDQQLLLTSAHIRPLPLHCPSPSYFKSYQFKWHLNSDFLIFSHYLLLYCFF